MASRFASQTILITGGSSGIGLATAKRVASEGVRWCFWRDAGRLDAAKAALEGENHVSRVCDVTDEAAVIEAFKATQN